MTFLELANWRYTTKKYDPTKALNLEHIKELKEIVRMCPSSINSQPWKFIFVENPELKAQLAAQSFYNENRINQAPLLIVFTVENNLPQFESEVIDKMPESTQGYYYDNKSNIGEEQVKTWMAKQVYIALGFCLSACAEMKLDSTPMEGIEPMAYKEILELEDYIPLFAVSVGYRDSEDFNQPSLHPKERRALEAVVESR